MIKPKIMKLNVLLWVFVGLYLHPHLCDRTMISTWLSGCFQLAAIRKSTLMFLFVGHAIDELECSTFWCFQRKLSADGCSYKHGYPPGIKRGSGISLNWMQHSNGKIHWMRDFPLPCLLAVLFHMAPMSLDLVPPIDAEYRTYRRKEMRLCDEAAFEV